MRKIFICYRHGNENATYAPGRIRDFLAKSYRQDHVFMDIDSIPASRDFRKNIRDAVSECQVFLTLIDKNWLDAADDDGNRRLDDPNDFVRLEIEAALERPPILVIPVLLQGAKISRPDQLPPSLQGLAYCNAVTVRTDPDFPNDVRQLVERIEKYFRSSKEVSDQIAPETVLIVVGTWLLAELYDRQNAELLRNQINHFGIPKQHRRAIVITDYALTHYSELQKQPVIAVGGPSVNSVTCDLVAHGATWDFAENVHGAQLIKTPPRVALWGAFAESTQEAVTQYMQHPDGLQEFLRQCWRE